MEESSERTGGGRSLEERGFFDPSAWRRPEFVSTCLGDRRVCVSIGLCALSAVFWVAACLLLVCKRCRTRRRNVDDSAASALYSFLGNLSGTVGAFMSNQLAIQVFMGALLTVLDILHFISIIIPLSGRTESRLKIMRKRRRQNIFAVSLPLVLGAGLFVCDGLYRRQGDRAPGGRRLLGFVPQDNSEILGYVLGLLSMVIGWTSKLPYLTKDHLEKMTSAAHVSFGILRAIANVLYGSAIPVYDARPASVLRALPWILTCFGCAALDVVILGLSCFRMRRGWSWDPSDTQSLLEDSPPEPPGPKRPESRRPSLQALRGKKGGKKMGEIGRYMDINVQPVQPVPKVFLKEVKISREGHVGGLLLKRMTKEVRKMREEDPDSSDSSSSSSVASSSLHPDLEWDFGEANAQWNKAQKSPKKKTEVFALRDWKVQFGTKAASRPTTASVVGVGGTGTSGCAVAVEQQVADPGALQSVDIEGPIGQQFAVNGK